MINITWNIPDRLCHTCILFCMEVLCLSLLSLPWCSPYICDPWCWCIRCIYDPVKSENCELLLLHDWNLLPFMHVSWPSLFAISQVFGTFVLWFVQILIILMNDKHNLKHTGQVVPHLYSFLHGGFVLVSLVTPLMQSIHLWSMMLMHSLHLWSEQFTFWRDVIAGNGCITVSRIVK